MEGYGTRQWATTAEVKDAGLFAQNGVVLGQWKRGWRGQRRILRYDGEENIVIVAPERSGKGTGIFIPTLLEMDGHTLTIDIRGATYAATAGYRSHMSRVERMALMQKNSVRFSLPQAIRRDTPYAFLDATAIAEMHINTQNSKGQNEDFWNKTSKALLTCALLYETETQLRPTMRQLARFWSAPGRDPRETLAYVVQHTASEQVAELGQEVLNKTDREASSILSTMMSNLFIYRDPILAENTSTCDFALSDFTQQDWWLSLYIVQSPAEEEHVRPFLRAFLRLAMGRWMETDAVKHRITMLLDEYPNLGQMDFHIKNLSVLGGYGIRTVLATQNVPLLKQLCGDPDLIMERCKVRVFYAAQGHTTAHEITRQTGTGTAVTMQESRRADGWSWAMADSRTQQEHQHSRALLTEAEAMEIPDDVAVIQVTSQPPVWAYKCPFWKHRPWKGRSEVHA